MGDLLVRDLIAGDLMDCWRSAAERADLDLNIANSNGQPKFQPRLQSRLQSK
jgi:hypothetical protein